MRHVHADQKVDVWSLGCVLAEILSKLRAADARKAWDDGLIPIISTVCFRLSTQLRQSSAPESHYPHPYPDYRTLISLFAPLFALSVPSFVLSVPLFALSLP
jgi:hypothetical protein